MTYVVVWKSEKLDNQTRFWNVRNTKMHCMSKFDIVSYNNEHKMIRFRRRKLPQTARWLANHVNVVWHPESTRSCYYKQKYIIECWRDRLMRLMTSCLFCKDLNCYLKWFIGFYYSVWWSPENIIPSWLLLSMVFFVNLTQQVLRLCTPNPRKYSLRLVNSM